MKLSNLFTRTKKDYPKDEVSISAQLLIRSGFIDKVAAGVYTLLPLGLKVANKISHIIRSQMDKAGAQEVLMQALVPRQNWEKSGRWEALDVLFKVKGADEKEYGLGATHEEIITPLAKKFVLSYKDLPFGVYQIQDKFRDELRAKSGVLRTREFMMKDLYSFHATEEDLNAYYEKMIAIYWDIFEHCGIKDKTHLVFASGGTFSKYSHEFQSETQAGEDEIYVCKQCGTGINKEVLGEKFSCPQCKTEEYELVKAVEVGNIFKLKTKYSEPFGLTFANEKDEQKPVQMGCYGIGIQRLLGTVVEINRDEKGISWPEEIAPYKYHLIAIGDTKNEADKVYEELTEKGIEVLYDDRDVSTGEKFADADLIGLPYRLVISAKNNGKIELKKRSEEKTELVDITSL